MLRIRHILHPTDFSETSAHAFRVAAALAHDYGARLTVAHVAPPPPLMIAGEIPVVPVPIDTTEYLRDLTHQLAAIQSGHKDVGLEHKLVEGDPAREVLALVDTLEADLIVMGTHGRTGLARLLMGSVAEQISRKAAVPVLLIKDPRLIRRSPIPAAANTPKAAELAAAPKA